MQKAAPVSTPSDLGMANLRIHSHRKILWLLAAAALLSGFTNLFRPNIGPVGEKHRPTLEAVWAQPEIGDGAFWKIYVRASDPDGDLDKVSVFFGQLGATYPPSTLIVPASQRKGINGAALIWALLNGHGATSTIYGTAEIHVEDRAGNVSNSKTVAFQVLQQELEDKGEPPAGFKRLANLGNLDFPLQRDGGLKGASN